MIAGFAMCYHAETCRDTTVPDASEPKGSAIGALPAKIPLPFSSFSQ